MNEIESSFKAWFREIAKREGKVVTRAIEEKAWRLGRSFFADGADIVEAAEEAAVFELKIVKDPPMAA